MAQCREESVWDEETRETEVKTLLLARVFVRHSRTSVTSGLPPKSSVARRPAVPAWRRVKRRARDLLLAVLHGDRGPHANDPAIPNDDR